MPKPSKSPLSTQSSKPDHRPKVALQRRQAMRSRLLQAALAIGASEGVAAITIDRVVGQAGVARGTFYKYFNSPADLVQALSYEVSQSAVAVMHPVTQDMQDPAQRLAFGVRTVLQWVLNNPRVGAYFVRSGWPAMETGHLFFKNIGANIDEGHSTGRFIAMPRDLALSLVAGTLVGAIHQLCGQAQADDFAVQTAAAVLRGLGLPKSEAQRVANRPMPDLPDFARSVLEGI